MTSAAAAFHLHLHPHLREHRLWKSRRFKPPRAALLPHLSPSLHLLAPALGFLSGAALFLSRPKPPPRGPAPGEVGQWLLVTAPTPFNRFVLLRCPSILLAEEETDERLLREGRRFVNLSAGKISMAAREGSGDLAYQRVCVGAEDGGVVSLDWPANLDLGKEHGLDTTVLLVPGTPQGSMDGNVRSLVSYALRCGYFPVVMNPRGCAGSPLTTARLFSAADSDDVRTAVKFINKLRPWSMMMAVGWGYGANMLTKYLAEVGDDTPLTAAVCIDNPFDLEEASRSFPHHIALDKKLMDGLIDILQANKELFQGRTKGFGVTQGLSATSVREFDGAISMVSYGSHTIEEFYSKTSTRELVGNLQIPVLFIQTDDGTVPLFSVPRATIAENPFTSLLLCTCKPSNHIKMGNFAILWCQQVVIEWLSAVELALLNGRHPLLKDVDITINPSKGLSLLDDQGPEKRFSIGGSISMSKAFDQSSSKYRDRFLAEFVDQTKSSYLDEYSVNGSSNIVVAGKVDSYVEQDSSQQKNSSNTNLADKSEENALETVRGEVIQTAEVVINMLDASLPGTLADDQKKKVLTAVAQGETFLKALQGAVPEDVRGKLTAAVSEIVQTEGLNLNLDGLKGVKLPSIPSEVKLKIREKLTGNAKKGIDGNLGEPNKGEIGKEAYHSNESHMEFVSREHDVGMSEEPDLHMPLKVTNSVDSEKSQQETDLERDTPLSSSKDASEYGQSHERSEPGRESSTQASNNIENELPEKNMDGNDNQEAVMQEKIKPTPSDPGKHADQTSIREANDIQKDKQLETQNDPGKQQFNSQGDVMSSPSLQSFEHQDVLESESESNSSGDKQSIGQAIVGKSEEIPPTDLSSPPSSAPSPISVSQALDALTGFDDSTQMAVNRVFGVIENMIDQLEKDNSHNNNEKISNEEDIASSREKPSSDVRDATDKSISIVDRQELAEENDFEESSASSKWGGVTDLSTKNFSGNRSPTKGISIAILNVQNVGYDQSNMKGETSRQDTMNSSFLSDRPKLRLVDKFPMHIIVNSYSGIPYNFSSKDAAANDSKETSLDLDSTTDLFLEYFPEEGQWGLLDQLGSTTDSLPGKNGSVNAKGQIINYPRQVNDREKIIEPSYVILDDDYGNASNEQEIVEANREHSKKLKLSTLFKEDILSSVVTVVLDTLKVEVHRRIGTSNVSSVLLSDMEQVAAAVALSLRQSDTVDIMLETQRTSGGKFDRLDVKHFVGIITSAVYGTAHLRKIIPVGVIVGSILASLGKYLHEFYEEKEERHESLAEEIETKYDQSDSLGKTNASAFVEIPVNGENKETKSVTNEKVMAGAVTAALGVSALLAHQKVKSFSEDSRDAGGLSSSIQDSKESMKENVNAGSQDSQQNNIVTSLAEKALSVAAPVLAEKALSVAAPVVPTKSDGEVDEEKLVNMLADLVQKGGMLKFIGKIALLWGGIRGAMSLTDRLISFLHFAERPLFQRVLGFSCMVIVLWSPVVVPLLPTLVQNWTAHKSLGIAEYACFAGLYASVIILVALWGKRTRGYEHPLQQYGLKLTCSSTPCDYLKGWVGGVALVMAIHSVNLALGFACFRWPSGGSLSTLGTFSWVKYCGRIMFLALKGTTLATCISAVEELLFRSWLPVEITLDLGYIQAIIISSFAFALVHRSFVGIPGLLLLSVALFGVKERSQGNLALPIGLHSGAMAATSVMKVGGFVLYLPAAPHWATGTYPWQPCDGAIGVAFCTLIAVLCHPPGFFKKNN